MVGISNQAGSISEAQQTLFRKSLQAVLPHRLPGKETVQEGYNIYPYHSLGNGKIQQGYDSLAKWMADHSCVIVDGFSGVCWADVEDGLRAAFKRMGLQVQYISMAQYLLPPAVLQEMVAPFLGERDAVWGSKTTLQLNDFFDTDAIARLTISSLYDCTVIIGTGAALANAAAPVVYLDVPKNEIQYRARAGSITNLGMALPDEPAHMYKQFYFVDWVVLNRHQNAIRERIAVQADVQWQNNINWILQQHLQAGLQAMATHALRVRPWFEAGAWGGQWMKERFKGLNKEEINYAWSFELIVPENGIVFESDDYLLEVPFDLLMQAAAKKILGKHADFFGTAFPIRFDFLDTWNGGNLSVQCHPSLAYIRQHFGEHITQDETYYILDCKEDAKVFLGFQEGIDENAFKTVLEESKHNGSPVAVTDYVQAHPAHKHDLFLIPNGTVHSAGADNLVLEISATPYIFTFKMYDWLRLDLNGEPRAINIEHAFNNLRFERQGESVKKELISTPVLIDQGKHFEIYHLPTHAEHFYDVHRLEFDDSITISTNGSCHVLMLVEGSTVLVETGHHKHTFSFAETFVVPAAANQYTVVNKGTERVRLVKAFIKDDINFLKK
ncbi:MAG TPA: class I mannose-6-phosphate isomerase [Chitinophagaceae bacterium]|nr:class I mannose-6-phosphate isomerase [Chitinophagaceae bacterium]